MALIDLLLRAGKGALWCLCGFVVYCLYLRRSMPADAAEAAYLTMRDS